MMIGTHGNAVQVKVEGEYGGSHNQSTNDGTKVVRRQENYTKQ